jgi:cell fate regulator YaaT (PSP1 superfamily)
MSQVDNAKGKSSKNTKQMLVRYGRLGLLGWFEHHESRLSRLNAHVVIKTDRGLELGQIVGIHNYRGGHFKSTPEQVEQYFCNRTKDYPLGEGGSFVRYATREDLHEQEHLEKNAVGEAKTCQRIAEELNLKMRIVEAEHLFGGERIIFYFTSENRVDFRELVKRLAREYQTRIELRQIGSRDEAKLISDYESCGQQCCCSRFLKILEPVNMRMAKLQKATLDPSKISGHCGRLKCCLRYEDQTYLDLKKKLPHRNTDVRTPKGVGKVVDVQILTQLVVVQTESGDRQAWSVDEIQMLKPGELPRNTNNSKTKNQEQSQASMSASQSQQAAITEELEEIAETEQELLETESTEKSAQDTSSERQNAQKQQGQTKQIDRSGKKKRRRRPKNKKRDDQKSPDNSNSQKRRPANKNKQRNQEKKNTDPNLSQPRGE